MSTSRPSSGLSRGLESLSEQEWKERLQSIEVNHSIMNRLVMDYLIVEGHKEAAECFMQESGTDAGVDLATVGQRMAIRSAVESGCISDALERIKQLGLAVLESNPDLRFRMFQLAAVELIRSGDTAGAIKCAQEDLAPIVESDPHLLPELERTMMLLAYDDPEASPEAALMSPQHRYGAASMLNAAILVAQNRESNSKLPMMLRMLQWAQDELTRRHQEGLSTLSSVLFC